MFGSHDGHTESVGSSNPTTSSHNAKILLFSYFSYTMILTCGIPSVTLEGEKSDWERLLTRLDKLDSFGEEPGQQCCDLYSLGSSEHSTASRTSTSGAEFVIFILKVQDRPTCQAGLQRFVYGQAKANGRHLLFQSPHGP